MRTLELWESYVRAKEKHEKHSELFDKSQVELQAARGKIQEVLKRLNGRILIHANGDSTTAYWLERGEIKSTGCVYTSEIPEAAKEVVS